MGIGISERSLWCVDVHNVLVLMSTQRMYIGNAGHLVLVVSRSVLLFPVSLSPVLRCCGFVVS
jgi:hypothetical protein